MSENANAYERAIHNASMRGLLVPRGTAGAVRRVLEELAAEVHYRYGESVSVAIGCGEGDRAHACGVACGYREVGTMIANAMRDLAEPNAAGMEANP